MKLRGVLPVLLLPFEEDQSVDFRSLVREIDWVFEAKGDGVVLAMVSETFRLTDAERDEVVRETVAATAGRGPVIASVGAESIPQAVRHARAAEKAGASALMAMPPVFTRCPPEELGRYYAALLAATALPIVIQDASGYVGNGIPVSIQAGLFHEHAGRVLFKPESQPRSLALAALREATNGKGELFEGMGGISLLDSHRYGLAGVMPGSDVPWAVAALWRALEAGDAARAWRIQAPLSALVALMQNLDAFVAIGKALLVQQGVLKNRIVRGPAGFQLDSESFNALGQHLENLKRACA